MNWSNKTNAHYDRNDKTCQKQHHFGRESQIEHVSEHDTLNLNLTINQNSHVQSLRKLIAQKVYLLIKINQNLTWNSHIQSLTKLTAQGDKLARVKHFIDQNTRNIYYIAYIQSHLDLLNMFSPVIKSGSVFRAWESLHEIGVEYFLFISFLTLSVI